MANPQLRLTCNALESTYTVTSEEVDLSAQFNDLQAALDFAGALVEVPTALTVSNENGKVFLHTFVGPGYLGSTHASRCNPSPSSRSH